MEHKFAIYVTPKPVDGEPVGYITADSHRYARRKVAVILKLGYTIELKPVV